MYFTINEYEDGPEGEMFSHMVLGGDYRAVPPPSSLSQEAELTPDQELERLIHQAEQRNQERERERAQSSLHKNHRQHAALSEDEMSDDPGFMMVPDEEEQRFQKDRNAYLDLYLSLEKNKNSPEYVDAYNERWSEFVPGHPMYLESDRQDIQRWRMKALQGLPKLPEQIQDTAPITTPAPPDSSPHQPSSAQRFSISTPISLSPGRPQELSLEDGSQKSPDPSCQHKNTTRQGSNAYVKTLRCKDCGFVLEKEKLAVPEKMKTEDIRECEHSEKDFRGTTATTWKWTCKKCGHSEKGVKKPGQSGLDASTKASSQDVRSGEGLASCPRDRWCAKLDPVSGNLATGESGDAMKVALLMVSTLELQQELGFNWSSWIASTADVRRLWRRKGAVRRVHHRHLSRTR